MKYCNLFVFVAVSVVISACGGESGKDEVGANDDTKVMHDSNNSVLIKPGENPGKATITNVNLADVSGDVAINSRITGSLEGDGEDYTALVTFTPNSDSYIVVTNVGSSSVYIDQTEPEMSSLSLSSSFNHATVSILNTSSQTQLAKFVKANIQYEVVVYQTTPGSLDLTIEHASREVLGLESDEVLAAFNETELYACTYSDSSSDEEEFSDVRLFVFDPIQATITPLLTDSSDELDVISEYIATVSDLDNSGFILTESAVYEEDGEIAAYAITRDVLLSDDADGGTYTLTATDKTSSRNCISSGSGTLTFVF